MTLSKEQADDFIKEFRLKTQELISEHTHETHDLNTVDIAKVIGWDQCFWLRLKLDELLEQ